MVYRIDQGEQAAHLFEGWEETIVWSCLQNIMGKLYGNKPAEPSSAMIALGDFCFLAGEPDEEIVSYRPERDGDGFRILVPQDRNWEKLIEDVYGPEAKKVVRYAIKKEPDVFDRHRLQEMAERLPEGYELKLIDEGLFDLCGKISWCQDWVKQYDSYVMYRKYGLGVVILKEGEPVSGASSYSGYRGGIEIEIDTREDFRRKGLASICGAKLIMECLKKGWYPSWDAQNKWSVALAGKLGYHFSHEYTAYETG